MLGLDWIKGGSATISPTALYTGAVWAANGLGDPALEAPAARALGAVSAATRRPLARAGIPTFEDFLLARHRILNHLLAESIETRGVATVVELAAGLSPRGLLTTRRFPDVAYIEVDLPHMARRKKSLLAKTDADTSRLTVTAADVFSPQLQTIFASVPHDGPIAIVSEGLLMYFPTEKVIELWQGLAAHTRRFEHVTYLSDLHLDRAGLTDRVVAAGLGVAVRGRVHFHFRSTRAGEAALKASGFSTAHLHAPAEFGSLLPGMNAAGADRVRVVEARRF